MIRRRFHGRSAAYLLLATTLFLSAGCDQTATSTPIVGDRAADVSGKTASKATDPTRSAGATTRPASTSAAASTSFAPPAPSADRSAAPSDSARPETATRAAKQPSLPQRPVKPVECTFDDVKFEMEKDGPFDRSMLTPEILKLVGKQIRIRGYILPSFQQTGLTQFVLVRDNMECCFGPGAALYDCILVEMEPGRATEFSIRPVAVEGQFSIRELVGPGGKHLAIYHLRGLDVRH